MWLFILILVVLIGIVWGYYYLITITERSINSLYQRAAGVIIDLTNTAQTTVRNLAQRTFRLLSFIGLPLSEAAELEGATLNHLHQALVEILNNLHDVIRNLAIAFTVWLGFLIIGTLGGLLADWIFLSVVVVSMIILFFITTTYDPIIASIAAKYKIRRSIRPVSLVYGLSGVMFMWWLAFHGPFFYPFWMYVLAVYILVLIALGFPSYYFMKTTNKAGITLNITLIVLLIVAVIRIANERIYTNASMYLTNNSEKIADNIADANAELTLNTYEVTKTTPVVTQIGKSGLEFGSLMTDSGEVILAFQIGDEVSVISEDIIFVGTEGYIKVMTKNEYGLFVDGPVYIPVRMIKQKSTGYDTQFVKNTESPNQQIQTDSNIQYLEINLPKGTKFRIYSESGKPFNVLTSSYGWQLCISGQEFEVKTPNNKEQIKPTHEGDTFWIE
jgi:hypothetical protein